METKYNDWKEIQKQNVTNCIIQEYLVKSSHISQPHYFSDLGTNPGSGNISNVR